jgi:hypothetical protein
MVPYLRDSEEWDIKDIGLAQEPGKLFSRKLIHQSNACSYYAQLLA